MGLSKPLPYTIQANPKEYTLTIRTISPEVCTHYGRRKCCWKLYSPDTVCGCKQHRPDRKNQPKFSKKDLLASMQQSSREAAAEYEANVAAHDEEQEAPSTRDSRPPPKASHRPRSAPARCPSAPS